MYINNAMHRNWGYKACSECGRVLIINKTNVLMLNADSEGQSIINSDEKLPSPSIFTARDHIFTLCDIMCYHYAVCQTTSHSSDTGCTQCYGIRVFAGFIIHSCDWYSYKWVNFRADRLIPESFVSADDRWYQFRAWRKWALQIIYRWNSTYDQRPGTMDK